MNKEADPECPKVVFMAFGMPCAAETLAEACGSDGRSWVKFIDGSDIMLDADAIIAEELRNRGT